MNTLIEEKFLLVNQYIGLLDIIDEAFGHILVSLERNNRQDAEQLWEDVTMAFMQIYESNKVLAEHFSDQPGVIQQFSQFDLVLEKAQLVQFTDDRFLEVLMREKIHPAFLEWSRQITRQFRPYYIN
ncbi:hypothetical protein [Bacillus sp. ISL-37]|uniref:hypothetical protein n=1 Tax=Bacillus sp. ISL-37 TaxID=2819123 RepID=UPI001BE8D80D|nr:hypothetical protein [Bacillus sp. ISL-37]MBT2685443.1 hypothetical protein [Bacillus sp. ISL-37]